MPIFLFPLALFIASCGGNTDSEGTSADSTEEGATSATSTPEEITSATSGEEITSADPTSSEETIVNQEDVDNLKSLLAKQDLSPFNEKFFFTQYSQNYSVYINSIDDDSRYVEFINYNGSGNVAYYYDVDEEIYNKILEKDDINTFDIMCQGFGQYALVQYATINAYLNDEFEEKEDHQRTNHIQQLQALFDDKNLQVESLYIYSDYFNDEAMEYRTFNGIIDKDTLFGSYTTKAISNIFSRVNIYDGPGYCEIIDSLYYQICLSLLASSDEEISQFIINNNVEYVEADEYSDISFELKEDKYIEYLGDHDVIPGVIKGTLHLDKETKALDNFEYKIIHFEESADYEANNIHTASMEFKAKGESRHGEPEGEPSMSEDPTVYTDPDEFMEQVIEQVIPVNAD